MQTRWIAVAIALALVGCESKKESAAQDPSKMTDDQILEATVKLLLEMSLISEASAKDCDRAADQLSAFVTRHEAMIVAFRRIGSDPTRKQELGARYQKELALMAERSIPLEQNCRGHERLEAVFARLSGPKTVTVPTPD